MQVFSFFFSNSIFLVYYYIGSQIDSQYWLYHISIILMDLGVVFEPIEIKCAVFICTHQHKSKIYALI